MTDTFTSIGKAAELVADGLRKTVVRIPVKSRGDWLALRRRDITASDIGSLFSVHPYRSTLQVYADKTGNGIDRGDNSAMRRGRIMEPAVAAAVEDERPHWSVSKAGEYVRDISMRLGATPDFYVRDKRRDCDIGNQGILEAKTAEPSVFERDWANGVPLAWTLQCLTQMMLTGSQWGAVAVMVMSRDLPVYIYDMHRHPSAEALIRAKVAEFWKMVEAGSPPAADYSKDSDSIQSMFPRERGEAIDLSYSNRLPVILARRAELSSSIKDHENEKNSIDAEIKEALGESPEGRMPGWRITWKTQTRKESIIPARDIRVLRITDMRAKEQSS